MDWAHALTVATMIGTAVGMVFRLSPAVANKLVPKIVLGANILGNLLLVANKFLEAAGIQVAGMNWWEPTEYGSDVALAGFLSFLKPLAVVVASTVIGYAQLALQRLVHEKGIKPVLNGGNSGAF